MAEEIRTDIQTEQPLEDTVVKIFRNAKVVKGGRRFSFSALVVVGDRNGTVGFGYGKAKKAVKDAKKNLQQIPVVDGTLPHPVIGKSRATQVTLLPASPGTGVIAGSTTRSILEYAGVRNALTKVNGSRSAKNVVKAVMDGLIKLRDKETVEALRGVEIEVEKRW
ncbi:MAG: 30S ribosomal protein S5 [Planctomycetota bacterium]